MMQPMHRVMSVDDMVSFCEENFYTECGPTKAFFHIPVANGVPMRAIYVTYAVRCMTSNGHSLDDLIGWMMQHVLEPLKEAAGEGAYLYWRLPDYFDVDDHDEVIALRTRIAVLDKSLDPVTLPSVMKPEGKPTPLLTGVDDTFINSSGHVVSL